MVPVLLLLVAVIPLTLLLVLPRLRKQRPSSAPQPTEYERLLESLPPERRSVYEDAARRSSHGLLFSGIAFIAAAVFAYLYLSDWLDDRAALFLTSKPQQLHIFVASLIGAAIAGASVLLWLQLKAREDRLRRLPGQALACIPVVFFSWALLQSGISVIFFQIAPDIVTISGTVVQAGTHVMRKSTTYHYADIRPSDGGPILRIRAYQSLHSRFTGYDVRVNQQCPIEALPEGLPIVLHGRRSNYGFALDAITTTGSCR